MYNYKYIYIYIYIYISCYYHHHCMNSNKYLTLLGASTIHQRSMHRYRSLRVTILRKTITMALLASTPVQTVSAIHGLRSQSTMKTFCNPLHLYLSFQTKVNILSKIFMCSLKFNHYQPSDVIKIKNQLYHQLHHLQLNQYQLSKETTLFERIFRC